MGFIYYVMFNVSVRLIILRKAAKLNSLDNFEIR